MSVGLAGASVPAAESQSAPPFPFAEVTIEQVQARMQAGELTSYALTSAYLDRIAAIDQAGPTLKAVIEVNPDALAIAAWLDEERAAGRVRGPLHGIPVLIKDNIATADRMQTTAGSLALVGARSTREAAVSARLRQAGAVLLGKTNLSEWAFFRGERAVSGWSARGGQTRNPYALNRSPSGSSSGSAVAVAANLCVIAVGTETVGSIVAPASACGVVGVKPTVGLVSRTGIIPISHTQDTAGPMARTVRDAAVLLRVLAGVDSDDAVTRTWPDDLNLAALSALPRDALRGTRLGVLRKATWMNRDVAVLRERIIAELREAGAEVVELSDEPNMARLWPAVRTLLSYEFKHGVNAWFQSFPARTAPVRSLADVIVFNEAHADRELSLFGQETLIAAEARGPLTDPMYLAARQLAWELSREQGIDARVAQHRLDALVDLTAGPAWLIDPVNGDQPTGASAAYALAAVAGYPSVTVPAGDVRGLPVGLSFVGPAWSDVRLLALAADFEARSQARKEPAFIATVNP